MKENARGRSYDEAPFWLQDQVCSFGKKRSYVISCEFKTRGAENKFFIEELTLHNSLTFHCEKLLFYFFFFFTLMRPFSWFQLCEVLKLFSIKLLHYVFFSIKKIFYFLPSRMVFSSFLWNITGEQEYLIICQREIRSNGYFP